MWAMIEKFLMLVAGAAMEPTSMAIPAQPLDEVEVIQAVFAAFAERDVEGVLRHADPEIVFSPQTADYAGRTEPYLGHQGLREYFRDVASVWDELRLTPSEFRQSGDTVLVTGRVSARSPARVIDGSTGWIWRLRERRWSTAASIRRPPRRSQRSRRGRPKAAGARATGSRPAPACA